MRKQLLTLSLAKAIYYVKTILKTYYLFIYRDVHYVANSFGKKKSVKNCDTLA